MVSLEEVINNANQSIERKYVFKGYGKFLLKQCIINSLKRDLDSFKDKKVFFSLSGGIDSFLLLAMAKTHFPEYDYISLSIGGSRNRPDIIYSPTLCEFYGIQHVKEIITKKSIKNAPPELNKLNLRINDEEREKCRKEGGLPLFLLYKFISKHTKKSNCRRWRG